jgi:hypothetical protein
MQPINQRTSGHRASVSTTPRLLDPRSLAEDSDGILAS